jgi:hypothetical protein
LCAYALDNVNDGWRWFCDLDVMLRDLFLAPTVRRAKLAKTTSAEADSTAGPAVTAAEATTPTSGAESPIGPSYTFVSLLFSKAILGHVCNRIDEWMASKRPFITILSAKENSKMLNNLCCFLALLLPLLVRTTGASVSQREHSMNCLVTYCSTSLSF